MAVAAGARISLKEIEDEINKSPLTEVKDDGKKYNGQKNIVIEGFDFTVNKTDVKQLQVTDCENVTIRRCKFRNKSTLGVALNITGAKTKNVTVEYCLFENLTYSDSNGGEPLRLGNSQYSGCIFNSTVRKCVFRNLKADVETISNKSCGNLIEDNHLINNDSMITVRHGGLATIKHNTFEGKGGVRLIGYGNKVINNLFKNNKDTGKRAPILVQNGNQPKDPNWTAVDKPSGKEGSGHAIYAQCVNNEIAGNEFQNCSTKIFYDKEKPLAPKDLKISDDAPTPTPTPPPPAPIPPTPSTEGADKYGIKKLYPDATGTQAQVWYMDQDNPTKDPRLRNEDNANLKKEADGSFSSDGSGNGKYQVRLEGWSESGQKRFLNTEITVYSQLMNEIDSGNNGAYAYQLYRGGGHHSTSNACEGSAYKGRIRKDKGVVIVKEIRHPDYTSNRGEIKKLTKDPKGNYIGTKLVVYNLTPTPGINSRTPVKIEVFCDEQGMAPDGKFDPTKQNWVKMAETIDNGGWAAAGDGGGCPPLEIGNNTGKRKPDEILNTSGGTSQGNLGAYRTDGVRTKIKFFSIREIQVKEQQQPQEPQPPTTPTPSPTPVPPPPSPTDQLKTATETAKEAIEKRVKEAADKIEEVLT